MQAAARYGLPCRVLVRRGRKPKGDIEAAARAARYRLLLDACREEGASHLLLAHHRDDQAENFLLRLGRGSGLFGLAAMRREIGLGQVTLFRPFLDLPRERLRQTVAAAGLEPVEDEMNEDRRFARVRIRQALPLLAEEGIDGRNLAETARRLADAAEAIDHAAGRLIAETAECDAFATVRIDPEPFFTAPREVRLRALARILLAIGGDLYPPRFERLAGLAEAMAAAGKGQRLKRTLAGTIIERRAGRFLFYREAGREGLERVPLAPGSDFIWDGRFAIRADPALQSGLSVAALGEEGRRLAGPLPEGVPAGVIETLPAVWRGKRLRAVPILGFVIGRPLPISMHAAIAERMAQPPLFPGFFVSI